MGGKKRQERKRKAGETEREIIFFYNLIFLRIQFNNQIVLDS
jgi:hypothetical protein